MPENTTNKQPLQPASKNHKLFKAWLIASLSLLILNTVLLSLALLAAVAFAATFIETAAPLFLASGAIGLVNLFIVPRSLSKKYFTDKFKDLAVTVVVLSGVAVLGVVLSISILAIQRWSTQDIQARYNRNYSEVTVQQATDLLNNCEVYELSYRPNSGSVNGWEKTPEKTASGILIFDNSRESFGDKKNKRVELYVAKRKIDTIVPIARQAQAQKSCDIKFRRDGDYEQ